MWLTSYDPSGAWPPTEVTLDRPVTIGARADHAWAHLAAPITVSGEPRTEVIIGARHRGWNVWSPAGWPVHVYVCTVGPHLGERTEFTADEVTIAAWGLLHVSRARAETDEF